MQDNYVSMHVTNICRKSVFNIHLVKLVLDIHCNARCNIIRPTCEIHVDMPLYINHCLPNVIILLTWHLSTSACLIIMTCDRNMSTCNIKFTLKCDLFMSIYLLIFVDMQLIHFNSNNGQDICEVAHVVMSTCNFFACLTLKSRMSTYE